MLDELLLNELDRGLVMLARDAPGLDALLEPRSPSSGENAGKPPARRGAKPPVSISILDLKLETEKLVGFWCGQLASEDPDAGSVPAEAGLVGRTSWLRARLAMLTSKPWGQTCAEELVAQALVVSDVVSPGPALNDPTPIEVGTAREIVQWARWLGRSVSRSQVQRWVKDGMIPSELAPDGRRLIRLADVLELAPGRSDSFLGHQLV